ncbi:MAG: BMC domain-containing protein [Alkalinema sp. RL_2_19]|nr:BMC domain-containing protein [Alkalinema sp. RL_2_19]
MDRYDPYMDKALGLISVQSFPAIVGVADMMLKSSSVELVGYEQIGGGHCTAVVRGGISDVRLAIETGEQVAAQFGQAVSSLITARPMPNLDQILPIGSKLAGLIAGREHNRFRDHAVGLVETIGFPPMVAAADAMLKSADVSLSAYHKIGAGLCTAIIRGSVSNVAAALEAGMAEAERVGELHSVMMIPRPLDDLERAMPLAECWLQELQPVRMPVNLEDQPARELQPLEIPETVPVEIPAAAESQIPMVQVAQVDLEYASEDDQPMQTEPMQTEPMPQPPLPQPPLSRPPLAQPADPLD